MTTPGDTLRLLLRPVYLPSFTYAAGIAALLPAQVLLALHLGFDAAQVALIGTVVGAVAVPASMAAGYLVAGLGEERALAAVTAPALLLLLATSLATHLAAGHDAVLARVLLVVTLLACDATDAVWSIARQGLVADLAPVEHRGRAMNVYGASQRLGRVLGPFVAAAVLLAFGPETVLPVTAALVAAGWALLATGRRRALATRRPDPAPPADSPARSLAGTVRPLLVLGLGVLALSAVRAAKETLIPLWGADGLHLAAPTVALIAGVGSLMELLLFWPAGMALDRIGRGPVAATCLVLMGVGLVVMPLRPEPAWFVATAMLVGLGDGVGAGIVKTIGVDIAPPVGRDRFLGWWQSISSVGSFVAPALAGFVIGTASLAAALPAIGALGLAGAAWMAWWTPRFVPPPHRRRS